ncbi:MAG: hypothetical protein KAS32_21355 [Candidatus Peribacteraceae bacterium]|nr:hypothetical protein [Candidatus Peribacteraceae bacterium]
MEGFKEFNLNQKIRVKIHEVGLEYLQDSMNKPDEDGYTTMQAWEFMQIFGPHTGLGFQRLHETAIYIKEEDLK